MAEISPPMLATAKPPRVASIDAFRGFVIMAMVFVNAVAGMPGVPAWMQHVPPGVEGMTFVDVVFPAFLFIVGMAVPVAFERRRARGESTASLMLHAVERSAGLVATGVLMVNMGAVDEASMGLGQRPWSLLVYGGMILAFLEPRRLPRTWAVALRSTGAALLVLAAAIFRRADGSWLQTSWWGILGLIGWAYLAGVACHAICRRSTAGLLGCMGMLLILYQSGIAGGLAVLDPLMRYLHVPTQIGSHGAIVVAGIVAGTWVEDGALRHSDRFGQFAVFGLAMLAAGLMLRPVHGFDKNNATDAWALASAGWAMLVFALFYAAMDWHGRRAWADFLRPAGSNPLMAYILPSIIIYLLIECGAGGILEFANAGTAGILRSLAFSAIVLAITAGLNRAGIILRF